MLVRFQNWDIVQTSGEIGPGLIVQPPTPLFAG
jgi:hypothetical protein